MVPVEFFVYLSVPIEKGTPYILNSGGSVLVLRVRVEFGFGDATTGVRDFFPFCQCFKVTLRVLDLSFRRVRLCVSWEMSTLGLRDSGPGS